ncbi:MAG: phage major capsid protein [Defluviitaleaceae bacterium]|nr:phage major capsid protein [Defluviitaleaceae bacterium]
MPKKNGKSELAAAIALLLTCMDMEYGAEIYGCATDRQQASIVFDVAENMVNQFPELKKHIKLNVQQKRMTFKPLNSFYQVLSAEAYQNLNGGTGMSDILTLREKRAKTWEAAKAFLDSNRGTDGRLSAENAATYDKMENDVVNMGKEIERLERAREIENEISAITAIPITSMPGSPKPKTGHASAEYNAAFWNAFRGKEISNALKVGVDTEGGFLVPDEFNRQLIEALEAENVFRKLANIVHTSSGEKQIPVVATKGTAAWVEEGEQIPESDNTFGQVILYAYKVATMIKVSVELLKDSAFPLEAYIAREFARRIGAKEEEAFFVGDGNKKPTGIFADTGGGQVGKTADSATIITHDDVIDLYYSLKTPYRARASFIANDSTVKMLRKVKSADGQYIWQPSVKEGTPDMIIGRPIYTSSYVPAIEADAKVLAFGDYSFYWIADRQARMFQRLNELYATTGQVGYLATQRVDGKLILPEAVQVLQMGADA